MGFQKSQTQFSDKTTSVYTQTHNGILPTHKKEWKFSICNNTGGLGERYAKWNKSENILRDASHMCVVLSCFSRVQLFATPWTVTCQAPQSMGFSRQECWSGLPFPSPGDLPNPGTEPASLISPTVTVWFFITSVTWEDPGEKEERQKRRELQILLSAFRLWC